MFSDIIALDKTYDRGKRISRELWVWAFSTRERSTENRARPGQPEPVNYLLFELTVSSLSSKVENLNQYPNYFINR